jgi:hypothetical protein
MRKGSTISPIVSKLLPRPDVHRLVVCGAPWTWRGIVLMWEHRLTIAAIEASATTMLQERGLRAQGCVSRLGGGGPSPAGNEARRCLPQTHKQYWIAARRPQGSNLLRRQTEAEKIGRRDLSPPGYQIAHGVREVDGDGGSQ